ncbi:MULTISPECIES: LLM class flavin-dependent oxidoreductase [unclassified Streptomyces]|uniref:LLM class flavin-dependent oxidoreductase n=1 Tax=unclassified Streptomyces TaxID=2593676 RepID=UPI0036EE6052
MLHLAASVDRPATSEAAPYVELARLAEHGVLDFVTLDDTFARPGPDALDVLSRVAPATSRIGLVPTVTTTRTEPFHVQAAVTALDRVSRGRAGWRPAVTATEGEARPLGGRTAEALRRTAGEVTDAEAELWGSRDMLVDGDTPGRDGRALDVDVVRPRPPQGCPVRVLDATEGPARRTAARYADVALVRVASADQAFTVRAELRSAAERFGRAPGELRVLASLLVDLGDGERAAEPGHGGGGPRSTARGPLYRGGPVDLAELIGAWHGQGAVDGFHLTPAESARDLERLVNGTVPLLQHRGLFRTFYPGSTLRDHLGLARPAHRYAGELS